MKGAFHGTIRQWTMRPGCALLMRQESLQESLTTCLRMIVRWIKDFSIKTANNNHSLHLIIKHCLPSCEEVRYTSSVSAAQFHHCDSQTMGSTNMCGLPKSVIGDDSTGLSIGDMPMWGTSVMDDYRIVQSHIFVFMPQLNLLLCFRTFSRTVPEYVSNQVTDNMRTFTHSNKVSKEFVRANIEFKNHSFGVLNKVIESRENFPSCS